LDAHPGTNDIILDKRKGFIRLALLTGTPIVPVFVFGENDLFFQVSEHDIALTPSVWRQLTEYPC
jgi:1-acyl-sn-glycerol-3-phosphate acyltransferase